MNKIWNELSEESKASIIKIYRELQVSSYDRSNNMSFMERLFGKENLNPEPQIKTWEDYKKTLSEPSIDSIEETFGGICLLPGMTMEYNPVSKKVIATYQIARLIELGYGGMITNEEWGDDSVNKFSIEAQNNKLVKVIAVSWRSFISFHTAEQRDEFLKNNEQLCKDYYMI